MCSWWILKSFEKVWKDFGDYKHIKTQIAPNKACAMHVPRLNNMFSIYFRLIPSSASMKKS